ncbi:putative fructose-bisphosphatase [Erysiphe necator]|uniref:fructose-2,6-bisphosphate 2-phosphatase n=1 Tax=Uncinula necator TaxID=52586 RepID=A0A0B1P8Y2_UNCNE|nr:putative fructose-bisphosphatase [Erysiphe necator]
MPLEGIAAGKEGMTYSMSNVEDTQICVVMVGLPARGKSLIAQKACRYLRWLSINTKVFNVGYYRRKQAAKPPASFFDVNNPEGERLRRAAAEEAVKEMLQWFKEGGIIGILDATNSSISRRKWIKEKCDEQNVETLFVESKCDDQDLILSNILEVKTSSPDYDGQDPEEAARDFCDRISNYEKVYETIGDQEKHLTYLKIMNVGSQVIINAIQDYLQSRVVYYLMNLHIKRRSIWLSRHGESVWNVLGKIGGDADLSPRGEEYARLLPELVNKSLRGESRPLNVWTSTLKRTIATARHLPSYFNQLQWKALDELDSGVCDNMTYAEIKEKYPEDFEARDHDKYNYRYRGGESYRDVVIRLEPIIMELERSENILIVTHQAILRCIYAYLMDKDHVKSPWMNVPLHTLIKITPKAYGCEVEMFKTDIAAVSTWRGKGSVAKHEDPTEATVTLGAHH